MMAGPESDNNQSPLSEPSSPVDNPHHVHHIIPVDLNLQPMYELANEVNKTFVKAPTLEFESSYSPSPLRDE